MYVIYENEQFDDETCDPIYLELGLNIQILFQSQTMLTEPKVSD